MKLLFLYLFVELIFFREDLKKYFYIDLGLMVNLLFVMLYVFIFNNRMFRNIILIIFINWCFGIVI